MEKGSIILIILEIIYFIIVGLTTIKIIIDTKNSGKTLAYLLLIIFVPIAGIIIYFLFGVNFRKNKFYSYKVEYNEEVFERVKKYLTESNASVMQSENRMIKGYENVIKVLFNDINSPLFKQNKVELLINGEGKFPKVFDSIKKAKHHIHIEYYIYDNDVIGNTLADLLIEKSREGVQVKFLYDAFGSPKIKRNIVKKLKANGVMVSPVNPIKFRLLANRINYRDHRKIIIIDGNEGFVGGINVSDKYINSDKNDLYWRDTHLHIQGPAIFYLQFMFLSSWIFSTETSPALDENYFKTENKETDNALVQFVSGGPDHPYSTILSGTLAALYSAKKRIWITTPYFIPSDALLIAIKQAAISGIEVKLIVPQKSDSIFVNAASYSYYLEIMEAGVEVFLYTKGFVHAKTIVIDDHLSIVGTANIDVRSQELNFEVNAMVYEEKLNKTLADAFNNDLVYCQQIDTEQWKNRNKFKKFFEYLARLLSPLL